MNNIDNKTLGQRISYYRKARNITQEELGEKCGVSSQAVSKWENDLSAPDITLLGTLAGLFGITTDELLGLKQQNATAVNPETINPDKLLLKIQVESSDDDTVKVNIPYKLGKAFLTSGISMGNKSESVLKNVDFDQIDEMVKMGLLGTIVDIKSKDGDTVKIFVEQL